MELYRRHGDRIRHYCLYRLRDLHEADDVTQETFARAWRSMPTDRADGELYPWLHVVARNLCTDALRRRARSQPSADPRFDSVECFDDPATPVVEAVDRALVGAALLRLNTRQRSALLLHETEGLTCAEIGHQTGQSTAAVESVLWRARHALKREFLALAGPDGFLAGFPLLGPVLDHIRRAGRRASMLTRQATGWTGVGAPAGLPVAGVALTVACVATLATFHGGPVSGGPGHWAQVPVAGASRAAAPAGTPIIWTRRPPGVRSHAAPSEPLPVPRVPSRLGAQKSPPRPTLTGGPGLTRFGLTQFGLTQVGLTPLPVRLATPGVTTILPPALPLAVPPTPTVGPAPMTPSPAAGQVAPPTPSLPVLRLP